MSQWKPELLEEIRREYPKCTSGAERAALAARLGITQAQLYNLGSRLAAEAPAKA